MADAKPKSGRKPGWLSIPGGPKEPKRDEFRTTMQAYGAKKTKLFDRLKAIRDEFDNRDDGDRDLVNSERKQLRERLNEIQSLRNQARDSRREKDSELKEIRQKRREIESQLRELSDDLGAFRDVSDIEAAIDRIMYKMETGGGSLSSEKATMKKLNQLEEAKTLLQKLAPMQQSIDEYEDRESDLMAEYKDIHARIGELNKDYEDQVGKKAEVDKKVKKDDVRPKLIKEREDIRAQLTKVNEEMDNFRKEFDKQMEAWNEWRVVAQEKYKEKIEAERKEREARWAERERQRKIERKKARAAKKMNPFESEIAACSTLITYLADKQKMIARDRERAEIQKKLATFDPASMAPQGMALRKDDEDALWSDNTATKKKAKAQKASAVAKKSATPAPAADAKKEKIVQHNAEKHRLFELVKLEAPISTGAFEDVIKTLREKKKEYESHIKTDADIEAMTTSEDDEEAEAEAEAAPEAAAEETEKKEE